MYSRLMTQEGLIIMEMFTIAVGDKRVTVLAKDKKHAFLLATNRHALSVEAEQVCVTAEFRSLWPTDVRLNLAMAANTVGEIPAYGVKRTKWALREAREIERKALRDEAQAEQVLANLPASERYKVGA